jgi:hypothetical protein
MNREEIIKRWPQASEAFIRANLDHDPAQLSPRPVPKPDHGLPLVNVFQGEDQGQDRSSERYHINLTIYSTRPRDWDNLAASCKQLQDVLVEDGWLPDDNYRVLSGSVSSLKCKTKAEHRTVVTLVRLE